MILVAISVVLGQNRFGLFMSILSHEPSYVSVAPMHCCWVAPKGSHQRGDSGNVLITRHTIPGQTI